MPPNCVPPSRPIPPPIYLEQQRRRPQLRMRRPSRPSPPGLDDLAGARRLPAFRVPEHDYGRSSGSRQIADSAVELYGSDAQVSRRQGMERINGWRRLLPQVMGGNGAGWMDADTLWP